MGQKVSGTNNQEYQSSQIRSLFFLAFRNQFHGRYFGRKRIDPFILFKMLVLQQLFNLSDDEVEFQVNDRRRFEKFVGLGVSTSHATPAPSRTSALSFNPSAETTLRTVSKLGLRSPESAL